MQSSKFLKNKLIRQLSLNGREFDFYGYEEDEYHENTERILRCTLKALYHEKNSYQQQNTSEGSVTYSKPKPMLLCLWNDAEDIMQGDEVSFGSKSFKVIAKNDIQDLGIVCDISLEEVD